MRREVDSDLARALDGWVATVVNADDLTKASKRGPDERVIGLLTCTKEADRAVKLRGTWWNLHNLQHRRADRGRIHLVHGRQRLLEDSLLLGRARRLVERSKV
eukprot:3832431-Prymnesium_polylepis.4